ncbi:Uncharacterized protein MCHI_001610 [Candidatus Magnetoovum chiemensis]|nr:Uncharacterized protein MCHI_001610 [Candidatus Magnetoovum chiemensis]
MEIKRIDENRIEIPIGYKEGMRVPGIIYVNESLEEHLEHDAIVQVANVSTLPGIMGASIAMADIHTGYGFPIGAVAAFEPNSGIISPGGVGYDINCGVRLVRSDLLKDDITHRIKELVSALYNEIPTGVGTRGRVRLTPSEEKKVLQNGARWAVENGFGAADDLDKTESGGCIEGADAETVSKKARERGSSQQGTLGSGNHFLELQYVSDVFDEEAAEAFGLFQGQITIMIHSGSRGLGHQVCTDYLSIIEEASKSYDISVPDRELAAVPFHSPQGQDYFSAMKASANYAWSNRQLLMHFSIETIMKTLGISPNAAGFSLVYDVAHNIAKLEEHIVGGKKSELLVHRKGATRAFAAGNNELPERYKNVGQPVLIPGDMGRASYVLIGTQKAGSDTFGSSCHGAGRLLSRTKALKISKGRAIWRELEDQGIYVKSAGKKTLAEEMPEAYKDVSSVVDTVHNAGISKKVVKLKPLGVIKG